MKLNFRSIMMGLTGVVLALTSCTPATSNSEAMSEIYANVMAYGFSKGPEDNDSYCKEGELRVGSQTAFSSTYFDSTVPNWREAKNYIPQLERGTWANFIIVRTLHQRLPNDLDLGCKYTLQDIPTTHTENCTPINYFSSIGYNASKDQALVSRGASCNGFGCGALYFVELVNGDWVVTAFEDAVCLGE